MFTGIFNQQPNLEAIAMTCELLPGFTCIKDEQSKYLYCDKKSKKICGLKENEDVFGLTDFDIKCEASKCADNFIKQDKIAIARGSMKYLGYFCYENNDWKIMLGQKTIFKNNEISTVICYMMDITDCKLFDIARFLIKHDEHIRKGFSRNQFSYILDDAYFESNLSHRQSECLFFLLRGYSSKAIAKILNLSQRTIESYINDIKDCLGCDNKSQLIEKAWKLGYMNILPNSLVKIDYVNS